MSEGWGPSVPIQLVKAVAFRFGPFRLVKAVKVWFGRVSEGGRGSLVMLRSGPFRLVKFW